MSNIRIFEERTIRTKWNSKEEEWYFSVVDVCGVLSETKIPRNYWSDLKRKLIAEGSELHEKIVRLKLTAQDGKERFTDCLDTKGILRLIQSIPSKKAEPFKMWLAQVGSERLDEIADPEKAIMRGAKFYRAKGYTEGWINQRLQTIEMRKELTDEWKARGIEHEKDYAILTNEMTRAWSGMSVKEYKQFKEPKTFSENKKVARQGGQVANNTRKDIERRTGQKLISPINASTKHLLEQNIEENK